MMFSPDSRKLAEYFSDGCEGFDGSSRLATYVSRSAAFVINLLKYTYYSILMFILNIVMLTKLERYSKYIQLPRDKKAEIIRQAKISQQYRTPIPKGSATFSQENFAYLTVFDSKRPENMYKLKTYREGGHIKNPKAIVAMFHGVTSHINRGAHIAKHFAQKDIITVGYDFRGYGKSQGLKGYIETFDTLLDDSQKFIKLTKEMYPSVPIYGLGQSLGGAVAYHLSLKHKKLLNGTVLMAPALKPPLQVPASTFSFINFFFWLIQFVLPSQLGLLKPRYWQNSKNPNYKEYCEKDDLHQKSRIRLRTLVSLFDMIKYGNQKFHQYDLPFMIVHGGADKLISPQVAFELFEKSKTVVEDKEVLFYEQMQHDVWAQSQIHEIQAKAADWILAQAAKVNHK